MTTVKSRNAVMIEKVKLSEVELNLPLGTPARLRGIDANGNSITPTFTEVGNVMRIYAYSFELKSGEEQDIGISDYGMYMVASSTLGGSAIFICGSYKECFVSDGGRGVICDYTDGTKSIVFGRKEGGGNFFIKNNSIYNVNIKIRRISF